MGMMYIAFEWNGWQYVTDRVGGRNELSGERVPCSSAFRMRNTNWFPSLWVVVVRDRCYHLQQLALTTLSSQATGALVRNVYGSILLFVLGVVHKSLLDIGGKAVEGLVNVDVVLGRNLEERNA